MKTVLTVSALVLAVATTLPQLAGAAEAKPAKPTYSMVLLQQIKEVEWNLKFSSIASSLKPSVLDRCLIMIDDARSAVAAGNLRAASDLVERAALPLHEMSPEAMAGKHPDKRLLLNEKQETLVSITDSSEKIAREKGLPTGFADTARAALKRSNELNDQGKPEKALEVIDQAYLDVQRQVARLRDGETFYLPIAEMPADRKWSDGLRRFNERKLLTEYLIIEASEDGIDTSALTAGMQAAEDSRKKAAELAQAQRWDQAMQSLEVAYAKFESSWKAVGLEW